MELTTAIANDWVEILAGLPQFAIQEACLRYLRDEPRKRPSPGAILALARMSMPAPRIVASRPETPEPARRDRVTAEAASEIMNAYGFRVKRMDGETE